MQFEQGTGSLRIPGGIWDVTGVNFLGGTQAMPSVFCEDGARQRNPNISQTQLAGDITYTYG